MTKIATEVTEIASSATEEPSIDEKNTVLPDSQASLTPPEEEKITQPTEMGNIETTILKNKKEGNCENTSFFNERVLDRLKNLSAL